jgi:hypothetical protein
VNLAQAEEEDDAVYMAVHCEDALTVSAEDTVVVPTAHAMQISTAGEHVYLNEERARVEQRKHADDTDPAWYLDSGASNHMTGESTVFTELNKQV